MQPNMIVCAKYDTELGSNSVGSFSVELASNKYQSEGNYK